MPRKKSVPELLGLLGSARGAPADLGRRQAIADWLERHGERDRAELVRIQCRLAGMPKHGPDYYDLVGREGEVLNRHATTWLGPLAAYPCSFHSGMLRLELSVAELLSPQLAELADTLTWAWVDTLRLRGIEVEHAAALAGSPLLQSIAMLDLAQTSVAPEVARMLGHCPALAGLSAISLSDTAAPYDGRFIAGEFIEGMASADSPPRLSALDLTSSGLSVPASELLTSSPLLDSVTHLKLSKNYFGNQQFCAFAKSKHLHNLQSLAVADMMIWLDGVSALAKSKHLGNLVHLDLSNCNLPCTIVGRVVRSSAWPRLRSLNLFWNLKLGWRAAKQFADRPWTIPLRELNLGAADLGDKGIAALANAPQVRGLEALDLFANKIGPKGAAALAASPHFAGLVELNLSNNSIGPAGVEALAASPHLGGLKKLSLCHSDVQSECFRTIARSPNLRGLVDLSLCRHSTEPKEYELAVAEAQILPNLRRLSLDGMAWNAELLHQLLALPLVPHLRELCLGSAQIDPMVPVLVECPGLANLTVLNLSLTTARAHDAHMLAGAPHLRRLTVLDLGHNAIGPGAAEALLSSAHLPNLRRLILIGDQVEAFAPLGRRFGSRLHYTYFEYPRMVEDE